MAYVGGRFLQPTKMRTEQEPAKDNLQDIRLSKCTELPHCVDFDKCHYNIIIITLSIINYQQIVNMIKEYSVA